MSAKVDELDEYLKMYTISVGQNFDDVMKRLAISLRRQTLGEIPLGKTVKFGEREYVVLEHNNGKTAVITKDFVKEMEFGESGDYTKSYVRDYCNGEFYNELCNAVGAGNIITHTVKLMADDGTGDNVICNDYVSLLTTELYRRYRRFLPAYKDWWWTATRPSADDSLGYARDVCYVGSNGVLSWSDCDYCGGVRPFCILDSSILVL